MTTDLGAGTASLSEPVRGRFSGSAVRRDPDGVRAAAGPAQRAVTVRPGRAAAGRTASTSVLPRAFFLEQLHREKRRSDRSKAPLSLICYKVKGSDCVSGHKHLLEVLATLVRETDIVGVLAMDEVAVICPDTGEDGVQRLMEKVADVSGALAYIAESATYPDRLFERHLVGGVPERPVVDWVFEDPRGDMGLGTYGVKRLVDVVGASLALLLLSPLMLLTALAVKFSSPGPVIFSQVRLGKRGVPFRFYKFRSMVVNGDDGIHREFVKRLIRGEHDSVNQQDASRPMYKLKADPRITWVGRIIRKASIDELPQLFNVLKGDLSLVGPRPPLPYEAESYRSWHLRRVLEVKPGITGLWQVEGRSRVSFDEMVRLDLRYARHCSLLVDLGILLRTVTVVLRCEGAK